MISSRLAEPPDARHDLFSAFKEQQSADLENLRQGELWAEAIFFFAAGRETIAYTLAATFFYLSRNPECYEKLVLEIRSAFGSAREIPILWREADPDEERPLVVDGQVIPPGTQVVLSIYSLYHNEQYFPEPFKFQPERWLGGGKRTSAASRDALALFSLGYRGCAGKAMAYLEVSLAIAKTLCENGLVYEAGEFPIYDLFAASHDGPRLIFRPRGAVWGPIQLHPLIPPSGWVYY
ncbi:cytochrome P450 [Xylariomycetidae sp. FL2044]|nr:cytochrome P450 [Xylariomycetidae sp. FL2044]